MIGKAAECSERREHVQNLRRGVNCIFLSPLPILRNDQHFEGTFFT